MTSMQNHLYIDSIHLGSPSATKDHACRSHALSLLEFWPRLAAVLVLQGLRRATGKHWQLGPCFEIDAGG